MTDNTATQLAPARRTILKGAAWSIPVIAAAVSTPLVAATTVGVGQKRLMEGTAESFQAANNEKKGAIEVVSQPRYIPEFSRTEGGVVVASDVTVQVIVPESYFEGVAGAHFGVARDAQQNWRLLSSTGGVATFQYTGAELPAPGSQVTMPLKALVYSNIAMGDVFGPVTVNIYDGSTLSDSATQPAATIAWGNWTNN